MTEFTKGYVVCQPSAPEEVEEQQKRFLKNFEQTQKKIHGMRPGQETYFDDDSFLSNAEMATKENGHDIFPDKDGIPTMICDPGNVPKNYQVVEKVELTQEAGQLKPPTIENK